MGTQRKKLSGYLTVYLTLTLSVLLSLVFALAEGTRRSTVRLETECIMDVGMNSVLAEYHRELFRQYGLLAVDASYGTGYPSLYNTEARLRYYLEQNLNTEDCYYFSFLYRDLLAMELDDVQILQTKLLTDEEGLAFAREAVQVIRSDVGLELAGEILSWVQTAEGQGLLDREVEAEMDQVDNRIAEENWTDTQLDKPLESIRQMRSAGALKWVVDNVDDLSVQSVRLSLYPSARRASGELNSGSWAASESLTLTEGILYREYLLRYSGHYTQLKEKSLLQYQTEYLIAGEANDRDNLKSVVNRICGIREAANTLYLIGDEEKQEMIRAVSEAVCTLLAIPDAAPVFQTAVTLAWAYLESLYDVKTLLSGGRVALLKEDENWHYGLEGLLSGLETDNNEEMSEEGMCYEDYLRVLLYLTDTEKVTFRFFDLMEMDIRQEPGNEAFRVDGCILQIRAKAKISSGYGFDYEIDRSLGY